MKDPNDFMLVESEGEQVKRLTAELAHVKRDLIVTSGESDAQADRIRALEAELAARTKQCVDENALYGMAMTRIRALEAELAAEKSRLPALGEGYEQLWIRAKTAEAYAARNALRVIAVEGEMENWRQIGLSNAARIEGLETSLRAALEAHESGNKYACGRILKTAASAPETSEVVK